MNFSYQSSGWKIGDIRLWYSKTIPPGWVICDGLNGTPKITGRVVVGAQVCGDIEKTEIPALGQQFGNTTITPSGKAQKHTLSISEMPSHNHGIPIANSGTGGPYVMSREKTIHRATTMTDATGGSTAHEHNLNLNPIDLRQKSIGIYYIMKVR